MTVHVPHGLAADGGSTTEDDASEDADATESANAAESAVTESALDSLTDPAALRDRDGIEHGETAFTHGGTEHCERGAAGRSIVGVTNADGAVLLLVHDEQRRPILPNAVVDPDEDWAAAARDAVETETGVAVELDGVERVRDVDHRIEGGDSVETTAHVVFSASPTAGDGAADAPVADGEAWTAGWYDELPAGVDAEEGSVLADIALFLDYDRA